MYKSTDNQQNRKGDIENIPCSLLVKLASIFNTPIDILVHGDNSDLCKSQIEEFMGCFSEVRRDKQSYFIIDGKKTKWSTDGKYAEEADRWYKWIKIAISDDEKYFVDTVEKMLKIYAEKNGKDFVIKKYTKPLQLMESLKEDSKFSFWI